MVEATRRMLSGNVHLTNDIAGISSSSRNSSYSVVPNESDNELIVIIDPEEGLDLNGAEDTW